MEPRTTWTTFGRRSEGPADLLLLLLLLLFVGPLSPSAALTAGKIHGVDMVLAMVAVVYVLFGGEGEYHEEALAR